MSAASAHATCRTTGSSVSLRRRQGPSPCTTPFSFRKPCNCMGLPCGGTSSENCGTAQHHHPAVQAPELARTFLAAYSIRLLALWEHRSPAQLARCGLPEAAYSDDESWSSFALVHGRVASAQQDDATNCGVFTCAYGVQACVGQVRRCSRATANNQLRLAAQSVTCCCARCRALICHQKRLACFEFLWREVC
jgi:hypothetical protein